MASIKELETRKKNLLRQMEEYSLAYRQGLLNKEDYLQRKFELFEGRFEDHVVNEIDSEINTIKGKRRAATTIIVALLLLGLAIPMIDFSGLTSLVIFEPGNEATLPVNQMFSDNATVNYTFITTDTLKASGEIYGFGETWIYLKDGNQTKLVYYADTRQQGLTGLVVGFNQTVNESIGTIVNETNTTENKDTVNNTQENTTVNETEVNKTNTTENNTAVNNTETNVTVNETQNNASVNTTDTNSTVNETAVNETETNTTANETTVNETEPIIFEAEINTDKETYSLGETVEIDVLPSNSSYTLYLHTPTNVYLLNEDYWVTLEHGNHTITGLITVDDETERVSKTFYVRNVNEELTASFTSACVETCSMRETDVELLIVVSGTQVKINNLTYTPTETQEINNTTNTTNATEVEKGKGKTKEKDVGPRSCLVKNPNARPKDCFTQEEIESKFPERNFTLINSLGMQMAEFDHLGNMHIQGSVVEFSSEEPGEFDFVVRKSNGDASSWINAMTGDLHLRGMLYENEETLMWESRQDYVISNTAGMYLAVFKARTGDLHLRGIIN